MKTRSGFVSNSSSSSFIVLIPDDLKIDFESDKIQKILREYKEEDDNADIKEFTESVKEAYIGLCGKEGCCYEDHTIVWVLHEILKDYHIASVEGGPDGGDSITAVDTKKVKKIMEKI